MLDEATSKKHQSPQPSRSNVAKMDRVTRGLIVAFEDVLIDATVWRRWLLKLLTRLGVHTNYVPLFRVWECDYETAVRSGRLTYWEAFREFLRAVGLSCPQAQEVELAARSKRRQVLRDPHAFPGVHRTLRAVRGSQVAMSVVRFSDEWTDDFSATLTRTKLRPFFDHQLSWVGLPNWQEALDQLSLSGEQVAFVGSHSWQLAQAQQGGLTTIGVGQDANQVTDYAIDELADLPRLIAI